jgi:superfamily II DNA or RNA helicase
MELKKYQRDTLDKIGEFLKDLEKENPEFAFMHLTKQPYKEEFFGKNIPFICIKIPTGGGKTLVGCHSVIQIIDSFLKEKLLALIEDLKNANVEIRNKENLKRLIG